jgi:hypothetical protein
VDTNSVFSVENGEFVLESDSDELDCGEGGEETHLASRINDVTFVLSALVLDALGEGGLDGRIIRFDEVIFDELYDK